MPCLAPNGMSLTTASTLASGRDKATHNNPTDGKTSPELTVALYKKATAHTHTHPFNGPFTGTTWVGRYQKGKTNLDFTEATDSEWQWHQLGHMQVCTVLQTDNHASTPPLSFLQARCPNCRLTNSVKALKAKKATATK